VNDLGVEILGKVVCHRRKGGDLKKEMKQEY